MEKVKDLSKTKRNTMFTNLFKKYLRKFTQGSIVITLPNGDVLKGGKEGSSPNAIVSINDIQFFKRFFLRGDIGFAESYMLGEWTTSDLKNVFLWAIANLNESGLLSGSESKTKSINLFSFSNKVYHYFRENSIKGSKDNISFHYDLGNDFYKLWLDESMTYSCGLFNNENDSLYESQQNKYKRIAVQLDLQPGDDLLEIGLGWGGFAEFLANHYPEVNYSGVTISREQLNYARQRLTDRSLKKMDLQFQDYRRIEGKFNKIVSIEMIEAVGDKYLPQYFQKIDNLLSADGVAVIQAITCPDSRYEELKKGTDFIQRYIFPGSLLPSVRAMVKGCKETSLHICDLHDIGMDYARTLNIWRKNFLENWEEINKLGFDQTFKRKWLYYLQYCEAAFETRNISDVHLTLIKPNNTTYKNRG